MSDASTATNDAATGAMTTDEGSTGPYRRPIGLVEAYRLGREYGMQEPEPIDAFTPEQADAYRRGVADALTVAARELSPVAKRTQRPRRSANRTQ